MTAYNVTTNFGSKDDLASGNTAKKLKAQSSLLNLITLLQE